MFEPRSSLLKVARHRGHLAVSTALRVAAIPEPQASRSPSPRVPAPFLLNLASLLWGLEERPPSTAPGRTQPGGRLQATCLRAWGRVPQWGSGNSRQPPPVRALVEAAGCD